MGQNVLFITSGDFRLETFLRGTHFEDLYSPTAAHVGDRGE